MRLRLLSSVLITATAAALAPLPLRAQHAPEPPAEANLPSPRSLTAAQWATDVRFLAAAIRERHPQPFHAVSEAAFTAATEDLLAALPGLTYEQTLVEISRLVALLGDGDGHSRLRFTPRFIAGQYPVRFWLFADGLFIRSAAPAAAKLAGQRVVGLGGVAVDEALARLRAVAPGDNEFNRRLRMATYLVLPELMQGLGLADATGLALEVEAADGARSTVRLAPVPWPEGFAQTIDENGFEPAPQESGGQGAVADWTEMRSAPPPLALSRLEEWYWMEPLDEGRTLFVQLNAIGNQDGRETMAEFFEEVFARCESQAVEKLILDVRYNSGGNNYFNRAVVHGLIRSDRMNVRGRTYVLLGRATFSAAGNLVTDLARETAAVFVGEPSGARPNSWGDARRVTLPESRLDVSLSTLYWQSGGPFEEGPWLAPDVAIDVTAADWAAGRDPVLDATLALDPAAVALPFDELLTTTFQAAGLAGALAAYDGYKADPAHRYVDTERAMNQAGYYLLGNGMAAEAAAVFRRNVAAYPARWNPYDSLAEALMTAERIPGLSLAVIEDGAVARAGAVGVADAAHPGPIGEATLFEAASLTKPLFATIVLRLAERGEFDLDRPLMELLPYARIAHDPRAAALTARLVLSHRTGLPNWGPETLAFEFDPGERFGYSGEGYQYLQLVLEKVTGLTLDELARREVFAPAGMTASRLSWEEGEVLDLAVPHDLAGKPQEKRQVRTAMAAATLHTTAAEYARFVAAWINGELLRPETIAAALAPLARIVPPEDASAAARATAARIAWGLGWGLQLPAAAGAGAIAFHWGDNGDFKSFVAFDPAARRGIVYFTNSANGLAIGETLAETVLPDLGPTFDWLGYPRWDDPGEDERLAGLIAEREERFAEAVAHYDAARAAGSEDESLAERIAWLGELQAVRAAPLSVPEEDLLPFVGHYGPRSLFWQDGALWYQREGRAAHRLTPLTPTLFALEGETEFRLEVGLGEDGAPSRLIGHYLGGNTDESPRSGD